MTPYHSDPWLTVWQGDCREVMAQMEPESVHCVVTSPPYWGLRDYGTAIWLGGDPECDHVERRQPQNLAKLADKHAPRANPRNPNRADDDQIYAAPYRHECGKCGAVRQDSQLGLEPTPEEYVANMVAVFREVRRVLRADGTCWVNLGDSYAATMQSDRHSTQPTGPNGTPATKHPSQIPAQRTVVSGLKPKDLVGIPWRVAFALQADGWYLRSDIIWSKPNPMPESVTDRPTKAHEYLFLLSKSARYYYDADAVREEAEFGRRSVSGSVWSQATKARDRGVASDAATIAKGSGTTSGADPSAGRNLRSVWSIATQPYPGAHFATFPEALVEPCVKAGTSERGVCPECGAPWRRVVELTPEYATLLASGKAWRTDEGKPDSYTNRQPKDHPANVPPKNITTGWQSGCDHLSNLPADPVPATVLDPFAGSGTTGRVAQRLGRRAVLIDLNGEYLTQTMKRNADIPLGLETA